MLFRLVPALIAFPSPNALAEANERLREEIAAHQRTLASLEAQVEERTTELRSANAMLAVQAREAVHRSGNLLAVVSSLAKQTAKGADGIEQFLDAFFGRIAALAEATKSITQRADRASIELDRLVDERLSPLRTTYAGRVEYGGPALTMSPEAAQQISLALHELATNTQKYGLGANDRVRVAVEWRVADERFELVWNERGGTPSDPEGGAVREGFGTKLLTRVIPTVLKGTATRSVEKGHMSYRLEAPVEEVTADPERENSASAAARIIDDSFGLDPA